MKSSVFSPHAQPIITSRRIFDDRYSNDITSEIQLVQEGSVPYPGDHVLEYLIVYHRSFKCYELTIFAREPRKDEGWAWFYFPESVVYTAIPEEELRGIIDEEKEFFRRRHRHFSPDHLERTIKYERLGKMLEGMVVSLLHYDMFQRLLVQPSDAKENLVDIFGEHAIYQSYDLKAVSLLMHKPEYLIAVNTQPQLQSTVHDQFVQSDFIRHRLQGIVDRFKLPHKTSGGSPGSAGKSKKLDSSLSTSAESNGPYTPAVPIPGNARSHAPQKRLSSMFQALRASFASAVTGGQSAKIADLTDGDHDDAITTAGRVPVHRRLSSMIAGNMRRLSLFSNHSSKQSEQPAQQRILAAQAAAMKAVEDKGKGNVSHQAMSNRDILHQHHLFIRQRWSRAIRRVMTQNAVRRTVARLTELNYGEEYFTASSPSSKQKIDTVQRHDSADPSNKSTNTRRRHSAGFAVRTNDAATIAAARKQQKTARQQRGGLRVLSHMLSAAFSPIHRPATASATIHILGADEDAMQQNSTTTTTTNTPPVIKRPTAIRPKTSSSPSTPFSSTSVNSQNSAKNTRGSIITAPNSDATTGSTAFFTPVSGPPGSGSPGTHAASGAGSNGSTGGPHRRSVLGESYAQRSLLEHHQKPPHQTGGANGVLATRKFVTQYPLAHQQQLLQQ